MKHSDYGKAASVVHQHYCEVLDDLTEEVLEAANPDPVLGNDLDKILESYSHRRWYITACLDQIRHASATPEPAKVEEINCSRGSVTEVLADWLQNHVGATILSLSILDSVDDLTCIIVFRSAF